jgi:hypothetical protein
MNAGTGSAPIGATPNTPPVVGRNGVFLRCNSCHRLFKFLVRDRDGRDVCRYCLDGLSHYPPLPPTSRAV